MKSECPLWLIILQINESEMPQRKLKNGKLAECFRHSSGRELALQVLG